MYKYITNPTTKLALSCLYNSFGKRSTASVFQDFYQVEFFKPGRPENTTSLSCLYICKDFSLFKFIY